MRERSCDGFTIVTNMNREEKGLALLFDSPKGYDLEDGKPMVRIVRAADRVTCECDVVSRAHELAKPTTFQFGYQVTPVKPLQEGSELWVPQYGNRLPGMVHISPIVTGANFGLYPQGFLKTPTNTNNWIQAKPQPVNIHVSGGFLYNGAQNRQGGKEGHHGQETA